ncbi:F-box/LRR-repeat protein At5g63520 [Pyrus x bretschneideri]|uniref:F-box/LRR-repeat protein At5g63520 n=1 Tax=Pyrus x bretschneideri TaxID=225117 RepID=UPI00202FBABA|nr:F-box/LRR-repeat protein At5g63520 [Pyrus x bretschneideri]
MAAAQLKTDREQGVFSRVDDDILQNILGRLPGVAFAAAACVNTTWNKNCSHMLSRPKFASALSLNPDLHNAIDEVLAEIFSKPIRPDFVVAYIGTNFSLEETHQLITEKIGSGIPIITNRAMGLIGTDVETRNLREVNCAHGNSARNPEINGGLVVSVGFVPGLKVEIFPLPSPRHAPHLLMMEHFVRDILSYSGPLPPSCMMMFGDKHFDMNLVVAALDAIMPDKTAIVGDASASFMYTRRNETGNYSSDLFYSAGAALVFVKDQHKPDYMGEIEFHVTLSPGLMPFGPQIKTISSYETPTHSSWISAVMSEFEGVFIDSHTILRELQSQVSRHEYLDCYIVKLSIYHKKKMKNRKKV